MPLGAKSMTKTQIQKFREAARAIGAHDFEKQFDAALKTVAKAPVPAKELKDKI